MLQQIPGRVAAALAALTLGLAGVVGAGAAGGPSRPGLVNDVLSSVGVVSPAPVSATQEPTDENHGRSVSDAVHDAHATATPGAGVGSVACEAAHDRSTLPDGAQNAPGQQGKNDDEDDEDCSHIGHGKATPTPPVTSQAATAALDVTPTATASPNHGQSVSNAVHEAQATASPGPGRGQAVSEAACTAAHDRSTLPAGAQNSNAANDKDCTHPNAGATPIAGTTGGSQTPTFAQPQNGQGNGNGQGSGRGPQTAPGLTQPMPSQQQGGSNGRPPQAGGGGPKH